MPRNLILPTLRTPSLLVRPSKESGLLFYQEATWVRLCCGLIFSFAVFYSPLSRAKEPPLPTEKSQAKAAKASKKLKFDKPIDGPEFDGLIRRFDKKDTSFGSTKALEPVSNPAAEPVPAGDLAFGAYQRGYYLTALELALPLADAGDPAAQTLIAELYWNGFGIAQDKTKALEWYRFAADGGNRDAQFFYGILLLEGKLLPLDKKAGAVFLEKASKSGHAKAQFNYAQIITAQRPTWAGFKKALPFYTAAAESGLADAQFAIANIHAEAKGVPHNDDVKALKWLRQAADGGLDSAQVELGIWLANGRAGPKDPKNAFNWFSKAAAQGNVVAFNRLARLHTMGVGTPKDLIKAGAWHISARRAGLNDSEMDRIFQALSDIDKKRAIEAANQLEKRTRF